MKPLASALFLACLLTVTAQADVTQGSVGLGAGGGWTAPDGSAGAGLMARGGFKLLRDDTHLLLSIDADGALGIGLSNQSWSDGPPPLIGTANLRAGAGGKTNLNHGCGFFGMGGGEGGYNHLGVSQARVNAFVQAGLACDHVLGSQLDLFVGPIAKLQYDWVQQTSAQALAGGRAELVSPRLNLAVEGVGSVAPLSSGPGQAVSQSGVSASGEVRVWRGLTFGAKVAYDYYGYKNGPFSYQMDGVSGLAYAAWRFDAGQKKAAR